VSYLSVQDEIVGVVKTIPHVDVYEGNLSDEDFATLVANSDALKPFITISFGGMIDPRRNVNGITGAKAHSHDVTIVVRCVGSTDRMSRQVWQLVWDKLIGYMPANCSEIRAALYGGTGQISSLGNPTRYASVQAFTMLINSDQE
jgi:hypothetical protein